MRRKSFRGAWLLVAWLGFVPAAAWGQSVAPATTWGQSDAPAATWVQSIDDLWAAPTAASAPVGLPVVRGQSVDVESYAPSTFTSPLPIGSTRPEDGGFYVAAQAIYFTMSNPLKSQTVAVAGFRDRDGSITGRVDQFVGSGQERLNVAQLTGADTYEIGNEITLGWKFANGGSISFNWLYLAESSYRAGATLSPRAGVLDQNLANSFLYADVHNIPPEYSGPDFKIRFPVRQVGVAATQPTAQAAFGIWNGADIMTISFIQRFQQYDIIYREPIFETETYRLNGLVGPRYTWIWERFAWRTTAAEGTGSTIDPITGDLVSTGILQQPGPQNVGLYSNIVSNRMYGAVAGCEQEWYFGHGIVFQLKVEGTLYVDSAKVIAKYETADRFAGLPENKRAKRLWSIVPEADVTAGIMWYPAEYMQVYAGYQAMGFLNTLASRVPIDTDYSNLNPHWSSASRYIGGLRAGIAFTF